MRIPFFSIRKNQAAAAVPPSRDMRETPPIDVVLQYHEQTKHHLYRFASSLGYLDWDNQPDPFRRFSGSSLVRFPFLQQSQTPCYDDLYSAGRIAPQPLTFQNLSRFFRNSLAISAWKSLEDTRWSLRVNPSSGNLHPTESYLVTGRIENLSPGVYHYTAQEHALEQRAKFVESSASFFLVGFTSIHWREAWKYGERAYRYCQHDLGHAIASVRFSAALLGWRATCLEKFSESEVAVLLGLTRAQDFQEAEDEHPECLILVETSVEPAKPEAFLSFVESAEWQGHANRLSESHVEWEVIDEVAKAAHKPATPVVSCTRFVVGARFIAPASEPAEKIIQQRRSCLGLDAKTRMSKEIFVEILLRTLPDRTVIPFDVYQESVLSKPRIHFALFVHRVDGLVPGLYMLIRNPESESKLRSALKASFSWRQPLTTLPLYLLDEVDLRAISTGIACGQDLGGDGVFSLGMIAEFEDQIRTIGPWLYPRLFWEAGLLGQILYLEAEAAGIRATGIGCYYDDPMHELLGIHTNNFQCLYHFTMGGPLEDTRLSTEPAYPEMRAR